MVQSKFIVADVNALVEWVWDDSYALTEDYFVVQDTRTSLRYYVNDETNGTATDNGLSHNLIPYDEPNNIWAIADPTAFDFLYRNLYSAPPMIFDKVRVHFPIGYTFDNNIGFLMRLRMLGKNNQYYNISNYFYDKSDSTRLKINPRPFFFGAKQWGTYVEFSIPSAYGLVNQVQISQGVSVPRNNSINKNLTDNVGLSDSQPIRMNFYFLTDATNEATTFYQVKQISSWAVPLQPSYKELGIVLEEDQNGGDFYVVYATYQNSQQGFVDFMTKRESLGINHQLDFDIIQRENGIITDSYRKSFQPGDPWDKKLTLRPIFILSNTVAEITVSLVLTNLTDGTSDTRTVNRIFLDSEVSKYGNKLSSIKVDSLQEIRVYQNRIDNSTSLGSNIDFFDSLSFSQWENFYADKNAFEDDALSATARVKTNYRPKTGTTIQKVSYPVLTDRYNITSQSTNQTLKTDIWWGNGQLEIVIYPYDNIIGFTFAKIVNTNSFEPYPLPNGIQYVLAFKNSQNKVESLLYLQPGAVSLNKGNLLFKVTEVQAGVIKQIYEAGTNQFSIIARSTFGNSTFLYGGMFIPYDSDAFRKRQGTSLTNSLSGVIGSGSISAGITAPDSTTNIGGQSVTNTFTNPTPSKTKC